MFSSSEKNGTPFGILYNACKRGDVNTIRSLLNLPEYEEVINEYCSEEDRVTFILI